MKHVFMKEETQGFVSHVELFKLMEEALLQGFWNVTIDKKTVRAYVRDPFLAYAILHMKLCHWQD